MGVVSRPAVLSTVGTRSLLSARLYGKWDNLTHEFTSQTLNEFRHQFLSRLEARVMPRCIGRVGVPYEGLTGKREHVTLKKLFRIDVFSCDLMPKSHCHK